MQLGMIGLGKMGGSMTRRLLKGGHDSFVGVDDFQSGESLPTRFEII